MVKHTHNWNTRWRQEKEWGGKKYLKSLGQNRLIQNTKGTISRISTEECSGAPPSGTALKTTIDLLQPSISAGSASVHPNNCGLKVFWKKNMLLLLCSIWLGLWWLCLYWIRTDFFLLISLTIQYNSYLHNTYIDGGFVSDLELI